MGLFDDILDSEITIHGARVKMVDLFFLAFMFALGMAARIFLFDFESGDYTTFLQPWMDECHSAGGIGYLGITPMESPLSTINYGCMYQYILIIIHYLAGNDLHLIKVMSVIFDVVCAVTIMRIVYTLTDGDVEKSIFSFAGAWLLPTVVLNSAAWAQCDSIYTAFALLSVLHTLRGNNRRIFIYLALSYTFKQQAIFIVPFLIIMWLKGKVKARYVFYVPVIIVITIIPAVIAGRSPIELLTVYGRQVSTYNRLSMNYPSIYTVISGSLPKSGRMMIISAGTMAAVAAMGFIAYYVRGRKFKVTTEFAILMAVFTMETALFLLPVMHERYGYMPEILLVCLGVTGYRRLAVCAVMQFVSCVTYSRFLFGTTMESMWLLSLMVLGVILVLGKELYQTMKKQEVENA